MSSILEHEIVALDDAGHQQLFAESPDHWPVLALKVDSKRRRLWATKVSLQGFSSVAAADWGRSVLADGTGGGIYRLHGNGLRRIDHGDFISRQTIAICSDGRSVFVPDYVWGIAAFDLATGSVHWLSMKGRYALDGIDGLYCHGSSLVAVQNGTSPVRVINFALNGSRSAVVADTIVERATATLGEPTHGVFVGRTFFYIANSGWDALDDHGAVRASAQLSPALIMHVDE